MLSFATEFPVGHDRDTADFFNVIRSWLLGSPHTHLAASDLAGLHVEGDFTITKGNEALSAIASGHVPEEMTGVRYVRVDGGLEWTTTAVHSKAAADSWTAVRVSCESRHPAVRLPPAKKPVLVRLLLNELGGGHDGPLPVGNAPHILENTDIDLAATLITGRADCRLPIVYVSARYQGSYSVDANRLASDLAGMAHVVTEPNRPFSLRLKIEVDSENVYGGTVGVYWPDGGGRRSFFLGREFGSQEEVERAVFEEVRTALTNRRSFERCTWAYVQEAASRQAIRALRAAGSQEVDKYIETFDKEIAAKNQRLNDAETEIARLRKELRIYEARLAAGTGSLLRTGSEQDHYPNEVVAIVRDALTDACTRVPTDSRRHHVLGAVLSANPALDDIAGGMRERLRQLLRGAKGMDGKVRRGLEEMGFSITEDGKHYKLVFQGDDRYTFTLAKTGSDHRGGLNAASDIGRLLF